MSRIRVLPEEVSNRIAAGEVVERPASVVKELVDNALDAGARRIRISIEAGGRNLVAVTDDGCGMDAEDAMLCLEPHATSKLRTAEDLAGIMTMGFRGEALPSIASVSRFQLRSRETGAESGTEVQVSGGTIVKVGPVGCAPGTSIHVRNLFYNMPARRKFLRTVQTEEAHIEEMVLALALARPEVGFDLEYDGRSVFSVHAGSDLRTRAAMLLGRDTIDQMVEVQYSADGVAVNGFISRPGMTRATRREQRAYVNGRPIHSETFFHSVRDAYNTLVGRGRFPPVLVFLSVDPTTVDVNVHPAKREVRFHDSRKIGRVLATAIERALRRDVVGVAVGALPQVEARAAVPVPPAVTAPPLPGNISRSGAPPSPPAPAFSPPSWMQQAPAPVPMPQAPVRQQALALEPVAPQSSSLSPASPAADLAAGSAGDVRSLRIIGELADRFMLAEGPRGLVVIDRRAAHERILFERILAAAATEGSAGQGLLIPLTLEFPAADADLLRRSLPRLIELGFELEDFGGNSFLLAAVPAHFPHENLAAMMREMVDLLRQEGNTGRRLDVRRIAQLAGAAAIQAQDRLDTLGRDRLLEDLAATELPYVCPRGCPTIITIPHSELLKRFGRR